MRQKETNIIKSKAKQGNMFIFIALLAFIFIFCSVNVAIAGKKVVLSSKNIEIEKGTSQVIKLSGADKKTEWRIKKGQDKISLEKVNENNNSVTIYGKKAGKAKVQAKFKGKTYICNVSVVKASSNTNTEVNNPDDEWEAVADFGSKLFQNTWEKDKNIMVSPVSVFNALAMTANGANGETLSQFEKVFGIPLEKCNSYMKSYNESLPSGDKYKLNVANSIWVKNSFNIKEDFLQKNKEIFRAEVYQTEFDNNALEKINGWVKQKTDGMIPEIIDKVDNEIQMCLINALAFDAEWKKVYSEDEVKEDIFTKENGETSNVQYMYSEENTYIEDKNTTGFVKYYKDNKYAFVALLPKKSTNMENYIKTLDGKKLKKLIDNRKDTVVKASIPKFKSEYFASLKQMLQTMGLTDAFDENIADFTGMGLSENNLSLYIDDVLHKTFIEVDERGTKAGAATAVIMKECGAVMNEEIKTVYLDRPFVYMIVDCDSWLPAFLGVVQGL